MMKISIAALLMGAPAIMLAQWPLFPTAGAPRLANGRVDVKRPRRKQPMANPTCPVSGLALTGRVDREGVRAVRQTLSRQALAMPVFRRAGTT